jgi:large subunit ribosomal protein L28
LLAQEGENQVARVCEICGKKPMTGNTISHAHNVNKTRRLPNLQSVRATVDGSPRRMMVCTRCLRSGKVTKSVKRTA